MNAELLLAHYERIADAPDAVASLRRFILDLAVRGKLVSQDPNDEPAPELLKRIETEKARLVEIGMIRKEMSPTRISGDELPFSIPHGWARARLGNLIHLVSGQHLQPAEYSEDPKAGLPYITGPSDFAAEGLQITRFALVRKAVAKQGQLLLTVKGSGVGKTTVCNIPEVAISRQLMALTAIKWDDRFLLLVAHRLAEKLQAEARSLIPGISREDVEEFAFLLPPLAEQSRIVAKVDELMALCDRLETARVEREATRDRLAAASLARLNAPDPDPVAFASHARFALNTLPALTTRPDQIKQLRQTFLNLAACGKLVSQDLNDEPAKELLGRLKQAHVKACATEGLRARTPVAKLSRKDMWFDFPECWELSSFDELFLIVSGVTKGQRVAVNQAVEAPYLRVANVQRGYLDLSVIKTLTVKTTDVERYELRLGDVLMTEGGDWDKLGRAAIWREEVPGCIHQNHVFRVRIPSKGVLPEWVITYVNSPMGRKFFEDASKQTTNLASINMTQLRACPFPLPPFAEQQRIIAKVDELMTLCDKLEANLSSCDNSRSRLLDALLAHALTPATTALRGDAA